MNGRFPASEVLADLYEVARQAAEGGVRDPDLLQRVRERAKLAREETVRKLGLQEIGVQIIREKRNEVRR